MNKKIIEVDGKTFEEWILPSGAIIRSEIPPKHSHPPPSFNLELSLSVIEAFVTDSLQALSEIKEALNIE